LAICLVSLAAPPAEAQTRGNRLLPRYVTVAPPDQADGARILGEFRQLGLPGDYYLAFALEVLPRRGSGFSVPGRLWGSRNPVGPISRLTVTPAAPAVEERWLVQNGRQPQTWTWTAGETSEVQRLPVERALDPLAGTQATVFDLQMPFVHWPEFVFEGVTRIRGRTAHAFLLYPPTDFAAAHADVAGVRIYLDMQFHALMQAVVLDGNERPRRTLTVLDLKKVGDHWIVKSIDLRDERTRDKTRFRVTGVALDLDLSPQVFEPEALDEPLGPPARVQRVN
jgi:hypothetical protein